MEPKPPLRRSNILLGERHTSVFNRFAAKSIDLLVVVAVYFLGAAIWLPLGVGAAVLLSAIQDGWGIGQSIGKRIIGLRVVEDLNGLSCSFRNSLLRNFPLALAVLFAALPVFWVFFIVISLPILALEVYLLLMLESGVRLGDVLGNTLVQEYLEEAFEGAEER